MDKLFADGFQRLVIKADLGASGQQMCRVDKDHFNESQTNWCKRVLKEQGTLLVEPWLDARLHFSVQFEMGDQLRLLGFTRMENDQRGQYIASMVGSFTRDLDQELINFIYQGKRRSCLEAFYKQALPLIETHCRDHSYEGPLGIDAMIYRDLDGSLALRPLLELNPRFTMGRIALELGRHMNSKRLGKLEIMKKGQALKQLNENPLRCIAKPAVKIDAGMLPLNDPQSCKTFIPVFSVGR